MSCFQAYFGHIFIWGDPNRDVDYFSLKKKKMLMNRKMSPFRFRFEDKGEYAHLWTDFVLSWVDFGNLTSETLPIEFLQSDQFNK